MIDDKNIKKRCLNCGTTFYAQRRTAKYCDARCRVEYNRYAGSNALYSQSVRAITKLGKAPSGDKQKARDTLKELKQAIRWSLLQLGDADELERQEMLTDRNKGNV